jgi:hypothetical protein
MVMVSPCIATPDTNATYWVMPLDTAHWRAMVVHGVYPSAPFFNFTTYTATGAQIDTIFDADITPDLGSTNPLATPGASGPENYTIAISAGSSASSNVLSVAGTPLAWIVYRIYLPDQGLDATGGVGVPAVTLIDARRKHANAEALPIAEAETSLTGLIILLRADGFTDAANFLQQILTLAAQLPSSVGQLQQRPVEPGPRTLCGLHRAGLFSEPSDDLLGDGRILLFRQIEIVVIRGKAPVFPDTYSGGPISTGL